VVKPEHRRQNDGNGGPLRESPQPCAIFQPPLSISSSPNTPTNTYCFSPTHPSLGRRPGRVPRGPALAVLVLFFAALFALAACATTGGGELPSLEEAIEQSAAAIAAKLPVGTRVAVVAFAAPLGNLSCYIRDEFAGALVDAAWRRGT
jgi:hypothetical protein